MAASKAPSTIPGKFQKAVFTLSHVDTVAGDMVQVLSDILETVKTKDAREVVKLTPRITTVLESTKRLQHDVQESIRLTGNSFLSKRVISRQRANDRNDQKRAGILGRNLGRTRKSEALRRLEQNVANISGKKRPSLAGSTVRSSKRQKHDSSQSTDDLLSRLPPPNNGEAYTLRELVTYMRLDTSSPLFGLPCQTVHNALVREDKPPLVLCSYRTLFRWVARYEQTEELPGKENEGIQMGRPRLVNDGDIPALNESVHENVGMVQRQRDVLPSFTRCSLQINQALPS